MKAVPFFSPFLQKAREKISLPPLPFSSEDLEQTIATFFLKIAFYEKSFFHWRTESKFSEFYIYKHQNLDTIL